MTTAEPSTRPKTNIDRAAKLATKLELTWTQAHASSELINQRFHVTIWPSEILIDEHRRILDRD